MPPKLSLPQKNRLLVLFHREEKNVHNHHRKKIFWRTFLASKKNFPGRRWIQKPYKNQENHIHHRNLSSVDPLFSAKKSAALEQGGVCFLFSQFQINPRAENHKSMKLKIWLVGTGPNKMNSENLSCFSEPTCYPWIQCLLENCVASKRNRSCGRIAALLWAASILHTM